MANDKTATIKDPKLDNAQYQRGVLYFLDDERYKRLDEEGKKEKLNMFFDKYTSNYLKQQGVEDTESYRDQFLNRYLQPKKKEESIDLSISSRISPFGVMQLAEKKELEELPEVSTETKSKELEERRDEIDSFDSLEFEPLEVPGIYKAERSSIPRTTLDPALLELRKEQITKQETSIKEAQVEVDKSENFKYIKEKPDVFLNNIEGESKKIGRELRKKGYSRSVSREVVNSIQQKANQDLLNSEKEKLFKYKSQEQVFNEAEELSKPYIDGWEEGTFINPQTGMRTKQPETDEDQDYLDYRNEAILNFSEIATTIPEGEKGEGKLDIDKVKSLHLDAYVKKQYWDRRAEEVGAQFREEEPKLGPVPKKVLEFVRKKRSQANAEFEATSLMLHKNIGPKDIEKDAKFNWQIFGNAFAESLAGEVNMMDAKSIDREILTKINEIGSKEFKWTEEEEKQIEATLLENTAGLAGHLTPDLFMLIALGQGTRMLKAGTYIERLQKGYKILRNPVLKSSGKAWKIVVGVDEAVPVGFNVLKTVKPTTWGKAQGLIYSSLIDEAVFTGVGGFQLGTMTGMNMAHGIRKVNYKGKWGKILGPFIDMVVKSGFGATVGMEAGAITGMAVKSLMDQDIEFRKAWDDQWGDMSEAGKRILAEFFVNTIVFGGMHLVTTGTAKKLNSPIGEEMKWYGSFSPKYRIKVLDAAREAEKLGYTQTAKQLYDWLDTSSSMLIGEEIRATRIEKAQEIIKKTPDSHLNKTIKSYEDLINILEQKKRTKKFDGKTEWIEEGEVKEFKLKDRYELNLALEEAYDKHGLYTAELAKRKTKGKEVQRIEMPEELIKEIEAQKKAGEKPEVKKEEIPEVKKDGKEEITPEAPEGKVTPLEIRKPGIPEEEIKPEEKTEIVNNLIKQREEEYEKVRKIEDLDERIKRATEVETEYKEKITAQKAEGVFPGMDTTGPKIRSEAKAEIRKKIEPPKVTPPEVEVKVSAKVVEYPVEEIQTDPEKFQQRKDAYVEEHVKNIMDNWADIDLDPLRLWKNPETGKVYVLAGHNRLEAARRKGIKNIESKFFEGTEAEAIEYARTSNVGKTLAETLTERASFYRNLRKKGTSKAEIKKQAVRNEGNNSERVIDYSHLNSDGRTIEILERFEKTGEGENTENIRNVAQFIGRARRTWPGLTNAHETEMADFMLNETNYRNFGTMVKFQELIENARGMFFDPKEPLNLAKIKERSYEELDYENKLREYENSFKAARDDLKKKEIELDAKYEKQQRYLKAGNKLHSFDIELTMEKRREILKPLEALVEKTQRELIAFKEEEGKYKEASKQGISLWNQEMAELEKGREDAMMKGDKMTEEELLKEINKLTEETKEVRAARLNESDLGYANIGEEQKTLDSKVKKMMEEKEKTREGFLVTERVKAIMKKIGVPIAEKYLPKRLLGIYKFTPKHIRVQRLRDVFVATHEAAHFISDDAGIGRRLIANTKKGAPIRRELTDIYTEFYPLGKRSHKLSKRIEEGMAVLFENYAYDPNYIIEKYPNLVDMFIKPNGEYYDKRFTVLLDEVGKLVGDYAKLTPDQQMGTRVRYEIPEDNKGFNTIQRIKFEIFNQAEPLKRYSQIADITGTTEDPFVSYFNWMNRNTFVYNFIKGQHRTLLKPNGDFELKAGSLEDVMKMVKNKEKSFDVFLVGRRIVEDHNRLVELKETFDELNEILEEAGGKEAFSEMDAEFQKAYLEAKADMMRLAKIITNNNIPLSQAAYTVRRYGEEFKNAANLYDEIVKDLVRFSKNTGLIKADIAEKYLAGKGYAPFFRFINDELVNANQNIKGTSSSQSKARMFKERTGGEEDILSPTFNLMNSIQEVIHKGLENMIWTGVYKMSLKEPVIARRFEKIETVPARDLRTGKITFPQDKDPNLLKIMTNGKRIYTKPAPEFVAVVKNLRGQEWDIWVKLLKIPSSVFTRLTTSANPVWALGNFTVDQVSGFMQTKTGLKPLIDPIMGIPDMFETGTERIMRSFKGTKGVQKLIEEGKLSENDVSLFSHFLEIGGKRQVFKAQFDVSPEEALTKLKTHKTKFEKITGIIDTGLNILELPSNLSEYMSRFAEFKRAKDMGKSDTEAMYMAAEVTVPFQLMGNWGGNIGKSWARSMPYFTAINAIMYKYGRTIKEQPGRVLTINAAIIASAATTIAAVMASASNKQKRLLGNMPARELARAIFLPCPWDDGKLIRIRVPEEIGALSGLVYLYMIQQYGGNEVTFHDYIRTLTAAIPDQYNIAEPEQMVMSWAPQAVSPTLEVIANKKTYPEFSPIVPQYVLDQKPPAEQYSEYTSKLAKIIGRWVNLSPAKIDYWVKNQFGAVGRAAFMWQLPYNPMMRQEKGHVMGGRAYNHFYECKEYANKEYNFIQEKKDYSIDEKRELIDDYVLFSNMGRVLSNFRRTLNVTDDVPEEFKEDAYQLLLKINKGEKGVEVLNSVEEFNRDILSYIKENEINIGVEYKVTRKKIEDSFIRLYRNHGLVEKKKYR